LNPIDIVENNIFIN